MHLLPPVLWNHDVTWKSRDHRCIFQYGKYSPPHGRCRGSWEREAYIAPPSARVHFILRSSHQQGGIWREKTEALPSFQNDAANALKVNPHPLLSLPCSKPFQIQIIAKLAIERNLTSSRWLYSFLNSLSEHGSSLKSRSLNRVVKIIRSNRTQVSHPFPPAPCAHTHTYSSIYFPPLFRFIGIILSSQR